MSKVLIKNNEPADGKKVIVYTRDSQGILVGTMTLEPGIEIETEVLLGKQAISLGEA